MLHIESLCFYYKTKNIEFKKCKIKKCLKNKIFLPFHSSVKWSDPGNFLKA